MPSKTITVTQKENEMTLYTRMLERIASNGYGVYFVQNTYMIADPLDGPDGFFLMTPTLTSAYNEMCEAELLYT